MSQVPEWKMKLRNALLGLGVSSHQSETIVVQMDRMHAEAMLEGQLEMLQHIKKDFSTDSKDDFIKISYEEFINLIKPFEDGSVK